MKLFLIRHAEAIDYETETVKSDDYRFITPKGRKTSLTVFKKLKDEFLELDKIFSSPLIRSVQTAEILASTLKFRFDVEVNNELHISSSHTEVPAFLKRNSIFSSVAIVGHNPMMELLLKEFAGKLIPFAKSGVACVDFDLSKLTGKFLWYMNPKTLELTK